MALIVHVLDYGSVNLFIYFDILMIHASWAIRFITSRPAIAQKLKEPVSHAILLGVAQEKARSNIRRLLFMSFI
jgi:hypothetical protein